jgi:hypothetical protein
MLLIESLLREAGEFTRSFLQKTASNGDRGNRTIKKKAAEV